MDDRPKPRANSDTKYASWRDSCFALNQSCQIHPRCTFPTNHSWILKNPLTLHLLRVLSHLILPTTLCPCQTRPMLQKCNSANGENLSISSNAAYQRQYRLSPPEQDSAPPLPCCLGQDSPMARQLLSLVFHRSLTGM